MSDYTLARLTRAAADLVERIGGERLHVHGEAPRDGAVLFVPATHTRLEALLLAYALGHAAGNPLPTWLDIVSGHGRIARGLHTLCYQVDTAGAPHSTLMRGLLTGPGQALLLPPQGWRAHAQVWPPPTVKGGGGAPHPGEEALLESARLALRVEAVRRKLTDLAPLSPPGARSGVWARQGLSGPPPVGECPPKTCVVPVRIQFTPNRPYADPLLRFARSLATGGAPSLRGFANADFSGTALQDDVEIHVLLGEPIEVAAYRGPGPSGAERLAKACANAIDALIEVQAEHLLAWLIRLQRGQRIDLRLLRNRLYLLARTLCQRGVAPGTLLEACSQALVGEEVPAVSRFLGDAAGLGQLMPIWSGYVKSGGLLNRPALPGRLQPTSLVHTLTRESARVPGLLGHARRLTLTPSPLVYAQVRRLFLQADQEKFETDYACFYDTELSKQPNVGRPFYRRPWRVRGAVVLVHGYMAAPLEIRELADYLCSRGYAVYGARMAGHGTSPEDLALAHWETWYDAMNRACAVLQTVAPRVTLSGFSTGGCVALAGAARKGAWAAGCIPICAPLQVRVSSIRLVPSIVTVNALLKRIGNTSIGFEFVDNKPDNPHINYTRNPLTGMKQLVDLMRFTQDILKDIHVPTLVLQSSGDPVVMPSSAQGIFDGCAATDKTLAVFNRPNHHIVLGSGSAAVKASVFQWLERQRTGRSLA
ncbi:serine aminopeptidase domain-containing protein [Roseovarius pacificus]|uniref:alpha/beta hydrolase n=1 Tax=Roseovarius pacificus TaxID=337701 RepID=UPI002A187A38|nr:alpha/beta hydrolase [Roseovarius pacificus]